MAVSACNLCEPIDDPEPFLMHEDWAVEQKLDGHRVLIQCNNGSVRALNRDGIERTNPLPRALRQAMASLPGEWTFDGELVGFTYHVFDLLEAPGYGEITSWPWEDRRGMLDKLFATAPNIPDCLRTTTWEILPQRKLLLYAKAISKNVEGVVFKRRSATYRNARTTDWLKFKFTKTAEFVVTEMNRKGKEESIGLGLYSPSGELVEAAGCRLLPQYMGKVTVGTVIEARYLYSNDGVKVVQPHMVGIRTDKKPSDCTQSQLIMTSKEIIDMVHG